MITLLTLVLKHDVALRLLDLETNVCLMFLDFDIICQCLKLAKEEWDSNRTIG